MSAAILALSNSLNDLAGRMEKFLLCEEKMKESVIMLEQTQRVYRTVHIDFHLELATVIYKLKILNRLFKPHLLQQLTVLKLDLGNDPVMHASVIAQRESFGEIVGVDLLPTTTCEGCRLS